MIVHTRKPVVVGVDGSVAALRAVHWAALRAGRDGVPLRIVHAYELPLGMPSGVTEEESIRNTMREVGRRWLDTARDAALGTAGEITAALPVETVLHAAPTAAALLHEAEHAALLVIGTRGLHPLTGVLIGSTSLTVAGQAPCPVVVVRGPDGDPPPLIGPVVVGVDGTATSDSAIAFAFAEAAARGVPLIALHAWTESRLELDAGRQLAEETLAERLAGWPEKFPEVRVKRELRRARPASALRRRSRTAQLVVVGCRGRSGFRSLLLGTTSQHLLHHADCPVAVVRPEVSE